MPNGVDYSPTMSEPDYRELKAEEERRLLRDFGYWDLVALGALVGAGLGFLYGLEAEPHVRATNVFAGIGVGALCAFIAGWARAQLRAREKFFIRWAGERGWAYARTGQPFEDTPFLRSGDRRKASDFFSGLSIAPGAVLYQHKRIVGSGKSEQVSNYHVLHFRLDRVLIPLLQIWPHSRGVDLGEKLLGHHEMFGTPVELESTELMEKFRISGVAEGGAEIRSLLTPSAIVKFLDFSHALSGVHAYFEIEAKSVAFLAELTLSPQRPQAIDELLEHWQPIASWLIEQAGAARAPGPGA